MRTCTQWGLKNCVQQLQNCIQNILGVNFRLSFQLRRRRQKYEEITKESENFEDNQNAYSVRSGVRKTAYTTEKLRKIRAILRYREHWSGGQGSYLDPKSALDIHSNDSTNILNRHEIYWTGPQVQCYLFPRVAYDWGG